MVAAPPHLRIAIVVGLLAVAGYLALHNAALAYGRRGLVVGRWIAGWCLLSMGFLAALLAQLTSADVTHAAWALRIQLAFSALLPPVLLGTVDELAGVSRPRRLQLFTVLAFVVAALDLGTPWMVQDRGSPFVDATGLSYLWIEVGPGFGVVGLFGVAALVEAWRALDATSRMPAAHVRRLRVVLGTYAALGLWDVAIALFDWRTLPLFQFAIVLLAAAFGALSVVHLHEQSEELERGVAHRTKELADANRELSAALAARHAADEARRLFLARMSHELRTPLNAISGSLELLERGDPRDDQRAGLAAARVAADALLRDLSDVLEYVRLESSPTLQQQTSILETGSFFESLVEPRRAEASERSLELRLEVEAPMPARLRVDAGRVRQLATILVDNALKFTQRGRVTVKLWWREGRLGLEVSDTGPGMDQASLSRIFEPLVTLDPSMTRSHGGKGLGLSLLKVVVDRLGGSLEARSEIGLGSTCVVALPAEAVSQAEAAPAPRVESARARRVEGRFAQGTRVLVAEDVALNRTVLLAMLRELGIQSVVAEDGAAALAMHAQEPELHAILMDCQMPVLDGYEATRRIRAGERGARLPILAVTAHALPEEHERALAAGMDVVLTKPVRIAELAQALRHAIPSRFVPDEAPPRPEVAEATPAFDPGPLEALRRGGVADAALLGELVHTFEDVSLRYLDALRAAVSADDADGAMRAAHALKGAAVSIGAVRTASAAHAIELDARRGQRVDAARHEQLSSARDASVAAARVWLEAQGSGAPTRVATSAS